MKKDLGSQPAQYPMPVRSVFPILGTSELSDTPMKLLSFTNREIGAAAKATLNRIRAGSHMTL